MRALRQAAQSLAGKPTPPHCVLCLPLLPPHLSTDDATLAGGSRAAQARRRGRPSLRALVQHAWPGAERTRGKRGQHGAFRCADWTWHRSLHASPAALQAASASKGQVLEVSSSRGHLLVKLLVIRFPACSPPVQLALHLPPAQLRLLQEEGRAVRALRITRIFRKHDTSAGRESREQPAEATATTQLQPTAAVPLQADRAPAPPDGKVQFVRVSAARGSNTREAPLAAATADLRCR